MTSRNVVSLLEFIRNTHFRVGASHSLTVITPNWELDPNQHGHGDADHQDKWEARSNKFA